jgi:hypothetical protein
VTDVERTLIVTAANAPLARALAVGLSPGGAGMFNTALSPTGAAPATHYVSAGWIDADIAALLGDAAALHAACVAAGAGVSLAQCESLVTQSDVSAENPHSVFDRLGLALVSTD